MLSNWYSEAESRPASLKVLFFFTLSHLFNYWAQLYNGLTLFDVQQLVMDSAGRTVFENQAKENTGGKWIKHQLFQTIRELLCMQCHPWLSTLLQRAVREFVLHSWLDRFGRAECSGVMESSFTASEVPDMEQPYGNQNIYPSGSRS